MEETKHLSEMLSERGIEREWVESTILFPDKIEEHNDGTRHYICKISEFGGALVASGSKCYICSRKMCDSFL